MKILEVDAKTILDSRGDETIEVSVKTNVGDFSTSAPNGKSKGKHEAKAYKKNLKGDIENLKKLSDYFSSEHLEKFEDLRRVEDILHKQVGANTLIALEYCVLKAIAKEQKNEIWQIINPNAKKIPRFVGNCIGGGLHSEPVEGKKPDFQEFLIIPNEKTSKKNFEKMLEIKKKLETRLKEKDKNFSSEKNDEDAWKTSLNEKEILEILKEFKVDLGLDVAANSFYKRKKYRYNNPKLDRIPDEQKAYLLNLMKNFNIYYIEDPYGEEEFEDFSRLLKKAKGKLIVGDDLTTTNYKRLEKAIEENAINGIIVKPNQIGSLLEVQRVVELAKSKDIKIIFSHRSGETKENILADLAFGFEADFLKCGITSEVREVKIKRIIEIEESLK
jgi:enolase